MSMLSADETQASLTGAWRLMLGKADGLRLLDLSADGFWNSFFAIIVATPALSTSGGTSDARFIKDYCPVVEFGLVGKTMHMVDERVALADLETLTQIYLRFIEDWFGQG